MGRWRPPPKAGSPYITAAGATALRAELQRLWSTERRPVVEALAAAAAEGDRSENAEYTYRKKQLGEIDRRIRYISKRLDVLEVVREAPADQSKVRFGAVVTLQAPEAKPRQYRIVGVDETETGKGWISVDSPLARALLGKSAGDEVEVELPAGRERYEILEVAYPDFGDIA